MKITHTSTPDGRPLTIATYDGRAARLPGHMSPGQVENQLKIWRALDAQQRKSGS